ncbi:MAG: hypothetical protein GPOALKHO_000803 [Sodalis sp.]|uniref:hypothetical protein n=1 Tax=Sodalis sp. (in: enterobacteria) TaxID=1898979 RepID=UPI003872FE74|nr:MAG: hypothetical protein GPOALKHO_000803 [Sodalis sp.]
MSNANPKSPIGGARRVVMPDLLTRLQMVHVRKAMILLAYVAAAVSVLIVKSV